MERGFYSLAKAMIIWGNHVLCLLYQYTWKEGLLPVGVIIAEAKHILKFIICPIGIGKIKTSTQVAMQYKTFCVLGALQKLV